MIFHVDYWLIRRVERTERCNLSDSNGLPNYFFFDFLLASIFYFLLISTSNLLSIRLLFARSPTSFGSPSQEWVSKIIFETVGLS